MIRSAVVAGQFYPGQKENLQRSITALMPSPEHQSSTIAVMSPHAGYMYSGKVAGLTFAGIKIPDEVIILGPNHTGQGHELAVCSKGSWETPLGLTKISEKLAGRIMQHCPMLAEDTLAHRYEHSLEVQLPFLQMKSREVMIVPICISRISLQVLLDLGEGLARAITASEGSPLIVASTDMTHYESSSEAKKKDDLALEQVLALDPVGLFEVVLKHRISMCGVFPTVVMLNAAKILGAENTELVAYSNSGYVTGDQSEVVGYAGVRIF